jgi:hypothetical protein
MRSALCRWPSYTLSAEPKGFKLAEMANIDLTLVSGDLTRTVTLTGSNSLIPSSVAGYQTHSPVLSIRKP